MEKKESFINDTKSAIMGSANGIILYDILWPYVVIILLQIILQDRYMELYNENSFLLGLIVTIVTGLLTLSITIAIVKFKNLKKAYRIFEKGNFKLIGYSLLAIFGFSYIYNLILLICGVDITGGNTNQNLVTEYIANAPFLALISMVILAPILEEITYRYCLFGGIRKYSKKWAILISGVVFMLVHAIAGFTSEDANILREIILLPPYLASGIILANAYDKSENLLVPTSIHLLNNLISFILSII